MLGPTVRLIATLAAAAVLAPASAALAQSDSVDSRLRDRGTGVATSFGWSSQLLGFGANPALQAQVAKVVGGIRGAVWF